MSYSSFSPVRRPRRRRWLLVALVAAVVIAGLAFTIQHRTEARITADYLAVTEGAVELQAQAASDLEATLENLNGIERPELMRRLERMHDATAEAQTQIDSVAVPSSAAEAHGYLVVATRSWEQAVGTLADAVIAVIDDSDPNAPTDLEDALVLLRVGDVAYAEFLNRVGDLDTEIAPEEFGPVAFVPPDGPVRYDPVIVQTRLTSIYRLGSKRSISVTAVTEPRPVGERNNVPIVPDSDTFVVQAVVANEGNEAEEQVSVTLDLIPAGSTTSSVTVTQTVATLEPGEARTCIFDAIDLAGGGLYELVVHATTPDGDGVDEDAWRMVFYRNEST
jgi:hypothetical protein